VHCGNLEQKSGFALRVHDWALDLAGELPMRSAKRVGVGVVDAELVGEPLCEGDEAAGQNGRPDAEALQGAEELSGAAGGGDDGAQRGEDGGVDAFEQGGALAEGGGEVELAVHGAGCDGGDLGLDADGGGDQVDYLFFDEGGVHVEDYEAGVAS